MKIVLEIILIAFLLFELVWGYKRGFIKALAKPVRFFASIVTAVWLAKPLSSKFIQPIIEKLVKNPLTNQIEDYLNTNCPTIGPENAHDELPTLLKLAASYENIDITKFSSTDFIPVIVDKLVSPVIVLISVVITFILTYFLAKLLYTFVIACLSSTLNKGVIGLPNRILGSVFCLLFAIVIAWAFVMIFGLIINSNVFSDAAWAQGFEGGPVYRFFSKNSPLDILLSF